MTPPPSETSSYLLYGIEALPVAVAIRPGEPGDVPQRMHWAIAISGFHSPGSARVSVREAGQAGRARSSRIKVSQYSLAPA